MSLEILNQLETRIQQTVNNMAALQQQVQILTDNNQELEQLINESSDELHALKAENDALKQEQAVWQQRIELLLNKIGGLNP